MTRPSRMRRWPTVAGLAAVALLAGACADDDDGDAAPALLPPTTPSTTLVIVPTTGVDGLTSDDGVGARTTTSDPTARPPVVQAPGTDPDTSAPASSTTAPAGGTTSSTSTPAGAGGGGRSSTTTTTRGGGGGGSGGGGGGGGTTTEPAGLAAKSGRTGARDVTTVELVSPATVTVDNAGDEPRTTLRYDLPDGAAADVEIVQYVLDDDTEYEQTLTGRTRVRGRTTEGFVLETAIDGWTVQDDSEPPLADTARREAAFEDLFIDQVVAPDGSPVSVTFDLPADAASLVDAALLLDLAPFPIVLPAQAVGEDALWTSTTTRDVDGARLTTTTEFSLAELANGCVDAAVDDVTGTGSGVGIVGDGGAITCLTALGQDSAIFSDVTAGSDLVTLETYTILG